MRVSDQDGVNDYLETMRRKNANAVRVFENNLDFVIALRTDTGQKLLKDFVELHSRYFDRMVAEDTKDWEKGVYRELTKILESWCSRITAYEKNVDSYNLMKQTKINEGGI